MALPLMPLTPVTKATFGFGRGILFVPVDRFAERSLEGSV
jgi:hypothetical protein